MFTTLFAAGQVQFFCCIWLIYFVVVVIFLRFASCMYHYISGLQVNSESRLRRYYTEAKKKQQITYLTFNRGKPLVKTQHVHEKCQCLHAWANGPILLLFFDLLKCLYVESPFLTLPIEAARNAVAASRPALRDLTVKPVDRKAPWPGKNVNINLLLGPLEVDSWPRKWSVCSLQQAVIKKNANIKKCAQR